MDTLIGSTVQIQSKPDNKVNGVNLLSTFENFASRISVLSLDCFDTLLWRRTATPIDVFYDLQNRPAFKSLGFNSLMRTRAEANARAMQVLLHANNEVTLRDIYQNCFPNLTEEQLQQLENDEVATEIETCYGFPPVVELIRMAHARGIKIIIVSDTYLRHQQLHHLLSSTLPSDIISMIDKIYCSNEHGRSKVNGLFKSVLKEMNLSAQSILHIGDNFIADCMAAQKLGLHSLHLIQHNESIKELFRMQATAACFMDPTFRHTRALSNPFKGMWGTATVSPDNPEHMIGYTALGPILYSFAQFIQDEATRLKQAGKKTKILFLMRDGYLPSLVCESLAGKEIGARVRISRFAALASSFRTKEDVARYLAPYFSSGRFADMALQLLLPENVSIPLIKSILNAQSPLYEFTQRILSEDILKIIFANSSAYRERLIKYLKKEAGIQKGDTLVFVDLGYSGTAQRLLEPILRDELDIEVLGRYLIALSVPGWNASRVGLLDPRSYDEKTMLTLISYIALFEQLCTANESSVTNFDDHGNPIFTDSSLSKQQHTKLDLIQKECIRFAKDAEKFFMAAGTHLHRMELQDAALSGLTRLLFLPTATEIEYLKTFQFELNLGTKDTFSVFDQEKGLSGLKRRGLLTLFSEKNSSTLRTNAPAELRAAGLEFAITLMAQHRYSLEFGLRDTNLRREALNIIIMRGKDASQMSLEAQLTHDGYFSLCIPVGTGNFHIGILFGQKYQWVQFESAEIIAVPYYLTNSESQATEDVWSNLLFEKMIAEGDKLYECSEETSLVMVSPIKKEDGQHYMLRIVFRPVVLRSK